MVSPRSDPSTLLPLIPMINPSPLDVNTQRLGLAIPISSRVDSQTTSSTTESNTRPPRRHNTSTSVDFSRLHLAPATRIQRVTTTTTSTIHFAPILIPRSSTTTSSSTQSTATALAEFAQHEENNALVHLDPKLYPLSQSNWPGGASQQFRLALGELDASLEVDGGTVGYSYDDEEEQRGYASSSVKGKGRAEVRMASERGAHAHRKKTRKSRTGGATAMAEDDDALEEMDSGVEIAGVARLPSPGPPRKRPRAGSRAGTESDSSEMEVEGEGEGEGGEGGPMRDYYAGALPSPNQSPPSPIPAFVEGDQGNSTEEAIDLGSGHVLSGLLSLPDFINTFDQLPPALQSYFIFTFLKRSPVPVLQAINNIIAPSLRRDFLTDLPPELGIHILGYLDVVALCRASVVCKGWRSLVDGEWRVWQERLVGDGLWIGDGSEAIEVEEINTGKKVNHFLERWQSGVWHTKSSSRIVHGGRRDPDQMAVDASPDAQLRRCSIPRPVNLASPSSSRDNSPIPVLFAHFIHPYKKLYRRRFITRRNWVRNEPERISFPCHANNVVTCLQFDKDKVVSASDDHSINVFDTRTGATKARLDGHEGGVWALQYIGNILVSGSTDRTVRVWDLDKAKCTHVFVGHTSTVRCLQIVEPINIQTDSTKPPIWEPPYPLIVTGSRDWSLRVWRLPSPDQDTEYHPDVPMSPTEENTDPTDNPFHLRHLAGHRHAVRALAAHGRTLVSGSYDCTVRVWDTMTGECRHKLTGHSQKVYSVVYDHVRQQCASGSMDGTVKLWSTTSGDCLATLEGHTSLVGLLGLSHQHMVSAAADSTLRIWDPVTGAYRHSLSAHSGAITCFQHDEYKVVSGSDGTLKMWDVRSGAFVRDLLTGLTGVWQVGFDERFCVAAVQRNGQSEFEILDFGAVDLAADVQEEQSHASVGNSDELNGASWSKLSSAKSRFTTDEGQTTTNPFLAPRLGHPSSIVGPSTRVVRRIGSARNLNAVATLADSTLTSSPTSFSPTATTSTSTYHSLISAAAPPLLSHATSTNSLRQHDHLPDPFSATLQLGGVDDALEMEVGSPEVGGHREV